MQSPCAVLDGAQSLLRRAAWSHAPLRGMSGTRQAARSCTIGERLYVSGGNDEGSWFRDVLILDLEDMRWQEIPPSGVMFPEPRGWHSMCLLPNGKMALFGGRDNVKSFCDLFFFDPASGLWQGPILCSGVVPEPRTYHTCCWAQGCLVYFGGFTTSCSNQVFLLNPDILEWTVPLIKGTPPSPRYNHTAVVYNQCMYVIGGCDSDRDYMDVHCLDLARMEWKEVNVAGSVLPQPRNSHSLTLVDHGWAVMFGGLTVEEEVLGDCFLLDLKNVVWHEVNLPGLRPPPRHSHVAEYFPSRRALLITLGTGEDIDVPNSVFLRFDDDLLPNSPTEISVSEVGKQLSPFHRKAESHDSNVASVRELSVPSETTEEEEEDVEELRTEIAEQAEYISKLEGMLEEISRKGHESEIQKAEEVVQEGFHLRHQNQLLRQELDFARESARSERVEFQAQLNALRRDLQDAQQGIDMEQNTTFVNALAGTAPPGELRVLRDQNRSLEEELESLQAALSQSRSEYQQAKVQWQEELRNAREQTLELQDQMVVLQAQLNNANAALAQAQAAVTDTATSGVTTAASPDVNSAVGVGRDASDSPPPPPYSPGTPGSRLSTGDSPRVSAGNPDATTPPPTTPTSLHGLSTTPPRTPAQEFEELLEHSREVEYLRRENVDLREQQHFLELELEEAANLINDLEVSLLGESRVLMGKDDMSAVERLQRELTLTKRVNQNLLDALDARNPTSEQIPALTRSVADLLEVNARLQRSHGSSQTLRQEIRTLCAEKDALKEKLRTQKETVYSPQAKSELRHLSDQLHRERMEVERLEAELLKSGDLLNDLHQAYTSETELVHKLDTKLKEQREAYRQLQSELMAERDKRSALQTEILLLRVNGGGTPESPASPDGSKSGVDLLRDQVAILGREKLRLEYEVQSSREKCRRKSTHIKGLKQERELLLQDLAGANNRLLGEMATITESLEALEDRLQESMDEGVLSMQRLELSLKDGSLQSDKNRLLEQHRNCREQQKQDLERVRDQVRAMMSSVQTVQKSQEATSALQVTRRPMFSSVPTSPRQPSALLDAHSPSSASSTESLSLREALEGRINVLQFSLEREKQKNRSPESASVTTLAIPTTPVGATSHDDAMELEDGQLQQSQVTRTCPVPEEGQGENPRLAELSSLLDQHRVQLDAARQELADTKAAHEEEVSALKEALQGAQQRAEDLHERLQETEEKDSDVLQQEMEALVANEARMQELHNELLGVQAAHEENLAMLRSQLEDLEDQREEDMQLLENEQQVSAGLREEVARLQAEEEDLEAQLRKEVEEADGRTAAVQELLMAERQRCADLQEELNMSQKALEERGRGSEEKLADLESQVSTLQEALQEADDRLEQETSKHEIAAENFQRRIDELMEKVAEAEGEAHKNALRWREEKDRCSEVQRELEDLRDKYERATLDPNLDLLSVESASMHSASSPVEQEDIGAQQKRRAVLTRQYSNLERLRAEGLQGQLEVQNIDLQRLREEVTILKERVALAREREAKSRATEKELREQLRELQQELSKVQRAHREEVQTLKAEVRRETLLRERDSSVLDIEREKLNSLREHLQTAEPATTDPVSTELSKQESVQHLQTQLQQIQRFHARKFQAQRKQYQLLEEENETLRRRLEESQSRLESDMNEAINVLQSNSPTAIQELVQRRFGTTDEMAVDNAKSSHFADIPFVEEEEEEENLDEEENEEDDALDVQEAGAVRTKNPARKDSGKDGASVEEGAEAEESLPPEDLLGRLHTERSLRNLLESKQKLVLSRADSMGEDLTTERVRVKALMEQISDKDSVIEDLSAQNQHMLKTLTELVASGKVVDLSSLGTAPTAASLRTVRTNRALQRRVEELLEEKQALIVAKGELLTQLSDLQHDRDLWQARCQEQQERDAAVDRLREEVQQQQQQQQEGEDPLQAADAALEELYSSRFQQDNTRQLEEELEDVREELAEERRYVEQLSREIRTEYKARTELELLLRQKEAELQRLRFETSQLQGRLEDALESVKTQEEELVQSRALIQDMKQDRMSREERQRLIEEKEDALQKVELSRSFTVNFINQFIDSTPFR